MASRSPRGMRSADLPGEAMTPRRTDRAERLLDLVSLLLGADHPIAWGELVEAFPGDYGQGSRESSLRKWERDKAELVELGIPLQWVPASDTRAGGYVVDRLRYYMRDLDLAPEERAMLSVAGAAALEQPGFPLRGDLAHALNKLLFQSPRGLGEAGGSRLVVHLPSTGAARQAGVLESLGRALASRKAIRLSYRAFGGETTERGVWPYGLAYRRGAWFLVGHCLLRDAVRTFQVERIASLEVNELRPKDADFEVPEGFEVQEVVGREAWEYAVHAPLQVELRLDREVALLARSRFGEGAAIVPLPDGAVRVLLDVSYGEALGREVLRLAPHAELVAPATLRDRVARAAAAIAASHLGSAPLPSTAHPDQGHADEAEAGEAKAGEAKAGEAKAGEAKAGEAKAGEAKAGGAARRSRPAAVPGDLRERLRRALFIIPYAVSHPRCTVEELADAARLTPEQLLAELDFLRMVGRPPFSPADLVDIDVFDGKVEVTLPQGLLRPPSLTPLEAAALDAAASALAVEGGAALALARTKLRSAVPPEGREQFDSVAGRVRVDPGGLDLETARLIDAAIAERRELELTYWTAARGEASRRIVRPLERVLHQGYWYLHAYCCDRRERRLFRLDRAADLVLSERSFVPRPVDDEARFRRDSLYAPDDRTPFATVRIRKGPWAEAEQAARLGANEVIVLDEGGALLRIPAEGEAFVAATVLSLAGEAELLDPPELRERIARFAAATAARHGPP